MADADGKMRIVKGGWKNADKPKKIRIKRENVDSKKRKKQANTKRKKRKRERKENDAPFLLLRTAVKIYMYSPLFFRSGPRGRKLIIK